MVPINRESPPAVSAVEPAERKEEEAPMEVDEPGAGEPRGDPEVAPHYIQQLLPVFTHVFQSSMIHSIR